MREAILIPRLEKNLAHFEITLSLTGCSTAACIAKHTYDREISSPTRDVTAPRSLKVFLSSLPQKLQIKMLLSNNNAIHASNSVEDLSFVFHVAYIPRALSAHASTFVSIEILIHLVQRFQPSGLLEKNISFEPVR